MSGEMMLFPATVEEFMEQYKVVDRDHALSNGAEFVPVFRMRQWFDHLQAHTLTNADRIRAMTDEELAEWLAEVLFHCSNTICDERCPMYKCCCDQPSDNIEDWLKQEAKDNG